ncbi:MAG: type 1 glutamine amidotransferase [candidate division NC10 bacterium]|nr:type 1 glutamine amidotransferase [candidate division NC10 bacterium]MBI2163605.1 type 1 glutamine amidotransferase [candidate division NC10 bacterium]MBI2454815.1 type 1 glutamine amidotransferase [candidate division NC10 bacterium]
MALTICIINGYPEKNRQALTDAGVAGADDLYVRVLGTLIPDARLDVFMIADPGSSLPGGGIEAYDAFIWTGSNLTIYEEDPRVARQIEFARQVYEVGRPSFGSCWGVQMAAAAAGGEVRKNPRGRELGFGRKIRLTAEGRTHPMYEGKPDVFDGFIMHLDEVSRIPPGGRLLATNEHTPVQALEVRHKNGIFWATQYHPEYDLYEMARLFLARGESLIKEGFFADRADLGAKVARMETLGRHPDRKDLRWDLAIGDDLLSPPIRQSELRNWIEKLVIPSMSSRASLNRTAV